MMKRVTVRPVIIQIGKKIIFSKGITVMGKNHQYIINIPRILESHFTPGQRIKITLEPLTPTDHLRDITKKADSKEEEG